MALSLDSKIIELPYLDQIAYSIPHILAVQNYRYVTLSSMVAVATLLVVYASYLTVAQPKTAQDPIIGKDDPLYDPTDRDGSVRFLQLVSDLYCANVGFIGTSGAVLIPIVVATWLVLIHVLKTYFGVEVQKILAFTYLFLLSPIFYSGLSEVLDTLLRNIGYLFGLEGNLAFFFSRYKITLSMGNGLPLGLNERIDYKSLGLSKSKFREYEDRLLAVDNVKIIKPTTLDPKEQITSLIFDLKFFVLLPSVVALFAVYYFHLPIFHPLNEIPKANWIVNNMAAIPLVLGSAPALKFGSFLPVTVLLVGLFFYDVTFVFGTSLMESVSSDVDLPFKLIFPHLPKNPIDFNVIGTSPLSAVMTDHAMLGLGDIVIPSFYCGLCLRFDYFQFYESNKVPFHRLRSIGVPVYFTTAVISYISALIVTIYAGIHTGRAQPALLYIVPIVLISTNCLALLRGEAKKLWNYSELVEVENPDVFFFTEPTGEFKESDGTPDAVEEQASEILFVGQTLYEFEGSLDETDDTYVIEEDTDDDEDFEDDDLGSDVEYLLQDQE